MTNKGDGKEGAEERHSVVAKYMDELKGALKQYGKDSMGMEMVFRGQRNIKWPLASGAERRLKTSDEYKEFFKEGREEDYRDAILLYTESVLLHHAREAGYGWRVDAAERKREIDRLAALQHHGAATCFTDFTRSFLVALWFAAGGFEIKEKKEQEKKEKEKENENKKEEVKQNGAILCVNVLRYEIFSRVTGDDALESKKDNEENERKSLRSLIKTKKKPLIEDGNVQIIPYQGTPKYIFWEPLHDNPRRIKQESVFIFGQEPMERLAGFGDQKAYSDEETEKKAGFFIEVLEGDKKDVLQELENLYGIKQDRLFPDMEGFAVSQSVDNPLPNSLEYEEMIKEGIRLMQAQRLENAVDKFNWGAKLNPNHPFAYAWRGRANLRREHFKDAVSDFDKAIKIGPDNSATHNNRGYANLGLKRFKDAVSDFDKAIKINPDNSATHNNRGHANLELRRFKDAVSDFDKAIKINPDNSTTHNNRGYANFQLERSKDAVSDFDKAIKIDPDNFITHHNRGLANLELRRFKDAVSDFDNSIKIDPDNSTTHHSRGLANLKLERFKDAVSDFDNSIKINPDNSAAHDNRGHANLKLERFKDAVSDFDKAIKIDPDNPATHNNRGYANFQLKRFAKARRDFLTAKEKLKEKIPEGMTAEKRDEQLQIIEEDFLTVEKALKKKGNKGS